MKFCFNISLRLFDINSSDDWWELASLFDDASLSSFMDDNQYAKYVYFILENNNIIGFAYLLQYKNTDILNLEYGIKRNNLNNDYIYTVLTLLRDKVKGIDKKAEIKDHVLVTSLLKTEEKYNSIANTFGMKIDSNNLYNHYEVNPNCEDLSIDREKILEFLAPKKRYSN